MSRYTHRFWSERSVPFAQKTLRLVCPSSPCLPGSLLSTAQPAARPHRPSPETLQVENLLLSNQGTIKLCDFGSATTISHYPDYSWSAQRRALVEEEVSAAARTPPPPGPAPAGSSVAYALM